MTIWHALLLGSLLAFSLAGAARPLIDKPVVAGTGKPPEFFMDGTKNPTLLAAIRKNLGQSERIDFDGHFSMSIVPCGSPCIGFWFVDRRTGVVTEAPDGRPPFEIVMDVSARPDSDVIDVEYGSPDGAMCAVQHFRWSGEAFIAVDRRRSKRCE